MNSHPPVLPRLIDMLLFKNTQSSTLQKPRLLVKFNAILAYSIVEFSIVIDAV